MPLLIGEDANSALEGAEYGKDACNINLIPDYVGLSDRQEWINLQEQLRLFQEEANCSNIVTNTTESKFSWKALLIHGLRLSGHIQQEYQKTLSLPSVSHQKSAPIKDTSISPYRYYEALYSNLSDIDILYDKNTISPILQNDSSTYEQSVFNGKIEAEHKDIINKEPNTIYEYESLGERQHAKSSSNSYIEVDQEVTIPVLVATSTSLIGKGWKYCLGGLGIMLAGAGIYSGYKWVMDKIGSSENEKGTLPVDVDEDVPQTAMLIGGEKHLGSPSKYDSGIRNIEIEELSIDSLPEIEIEERRIITTEELNAQPNGFVNSNYKSSMRLQNGIVYIQYDFLISFMNMQTYSSEFNPETSNPLLNNNFYYDILSISEFSPLKESIIKIIHKYFLHDSMNYEYSYKNSMYYNSIYYYLIRSISVHSPEDKIYEINAQGISCVLQLISEGQTARSSAEEDYLSKIYLNVFSIYKKIPPHKNIRYTNNINSLDSFYIASSDEILVFTKKNMNTFNVFSFRYGVFHTVEAEFVRYLFSDKSKIDANFPVSYIINDNNTNYLSILDNNGCTYYTTLIGRINFLLNKDAFNQDTMMLSLSGYNLHDIDITRLTKGLYNTTINHLILDYNPITIVGLNELFNSEKFYNLRTLSLLHIHGIDVSKIDYDAINQNLPNLEGLSLDISLHMDINYLLATNINNMKLQISILAYKDALSVLNDDIIQKYSVSHLLSNKLFISKIHQHNLLKQIMQFNHELHVSTLSKMQIIHSVSTFYHSCILHNDGCISMTVSGGYSIMTSVLQPYTSKAMIKFEQKIMNSLRILGGILRAPNIVNTYYFGVAIKSLVTVPVVGVITSLPDIYQGAMSAAFLSNCNNQDSKCDKYDIAGNTLTVLVSAGSVAANIYFFLKSAAPLHVAYFNIAIEVALKFYQIVENNVKVTEYITLNAQDVYSISKNTLMYRAMAYEYERLGSYDVLLNTMLNNTVNATNSNSNIALIVYSIPDILIKHKHKIPDSIFSISLPLDNVEVSFSTAHIRVHNASSHDYNVDRVVEVIKDKIPHNLKLACGPVADSLNQNGFTEVLGMEFYCQNAIAFANIKKYSSKESDSIVLYVLNSVGTAFLSGMDFGINIFNINQGIYTIYANNSASNHYILSNYNINGRIYLGHGGTYNIFIINTTKPIDNTLTEYRSPPIYLGSTESSLNIADNKDYFINVFETKAHNITVFGSNGSVEKIRCNIAEFNLKNNRYIINSNGSTIKGIPDTIINCPLVILSPGMNCDNNLINARFILDKNQMKHDGSCNKDCNEPIEITNQQNGSVIILGKDLTVSEILQINYNKVLNKLSITLSFDNSVQNLELNNYFQNGNITHYNILFGNILIQPNIYNNLEIVERVGISQYLALENCKNIPDIIKKHEDIFIKLSAMVRLHVDGSFVGQCASDFRLVTQYGTDASDTFIMNNMLHTAKGYNQTDYYIYDCLKNQNLYIDNYAKDRAMDEILFTCDTKIMFISNDNNIIIDIPEYNSIIYILNYAKSPDYQHIVVTTSNHHFIYPFIHESNIESAVMLRQTRFHTEYYLSDIKPRKHGVQSTAIIYCREDFIYEYLDNENMILWCYDYDNSYMPPLIIIFGNYTINYNLLNEYDLFIYSANGSHKEYKFKNPLEIKNLHEVYDDIIVQQIAINNTNIAKGPLDNSTVNLKIDYSKYFDNKYDVLEFKDRNIIEHITVTSNETHNIINVTYYDVDLDKVYSYLHAIITNCLKLTLYLIDNIDIHDLENETHEKYTTLIKNIYLSKTPNFLDARINSMVTLLNSTLQQYFISKKQIGEIVQKIQDDLGNYYSVPQDEFISNFIYKGLLSDVRIGIQEDGTSQTTDINTAIKYVNKIDEIKFNMIQYISDSKQIKTLVSLLKNRPYSLILHEDGLEVITIVSNSTEDLLKEKINKAKTYVKKIKVLSTNPCFIYNTYRYILALRKPIVDADVAVMLGFYNLYDIPVFILNYNLSEMELNFVVQCINEVLLEQFKDYLADKSYVMSLNTSEYINGISIELFKRIMDVH